ncbi:SurA N-terminal domain-containing protein [Candidatus Saccharibacteria bacterium]|nr:SurA N-terminal domain-containing protein [Candidatus Saccharibacteria bacterium]
MNKVKEKVVTVGEKITDKLPDKLRRNRHKKPPARITSDTVEEHREKVLASGRKFKYPLQYTKHKIIINTIIVVIVTMIAFGGWLWYMLYPRQATSDFFYSATKILSLPVANVDGQKVPYADYLRRMRSAIFYKENHEKVDFSTNDGRRELNYLKRDELNKAERVAYATKIAKSKNLTISDEEINAEVDKDLRDSNGETMTPTEYENYVLQRYFGWTTADYRAELKNQLLERKVAFAVDTAAKAKITEAAARLQAGDDFATVAREMSDDDITREVGGGVSAQTGDADPNGLVAIARELGDNAISDVIQGVDGYYIVKLGSKTDDTTNYLMIKVVLRQFNDDFNKLRKAGKIKEYIKVPEFNDIGKSS